MLVMQYCNTLQRHVLFLCFKSWSTHLTAYNNFLKLDKLNYEKKYWYCMA